MKKCIHIVFLISLINPAFAGDKYLLVTAEGKRYESAELQSVGEDTLYARVDGRDYNLAIDDLGWLEQEKEGGWKLPLLGCIGGCAVGSAVGITIADRGESLGEVFIPLMAGPIVGMAGGLMLSTDEQSDKNGSIIHDLRSMSRQERRAHLQTMIKIR